MSYLYIVEIQVIVTRPQTPQARQALQVVRAPQPLPTALILKNHPHLHPRKENKNPKRRIINLKSHQIVTLKIYILHCFDPSIRLLYIALHYQECIECYRIWMGDVITKNCRCEKCGK